jgi:hypothetical protein
MIVNEWSAAPVCVVMQEWRSGRWASNKSVWKKWGVWGDEEGATVVRYTVCFTAIEDVEFSKEAIECDQEFEQDAKHGVGLVDIGNIKYKRYLWQR